MVKVRMNTADVAAQVKCLRRLIGMRCANVYDLSPKTYVFKLMKSSGVTESGESEKVLLLIESGIRLHTTVFARDKSSTPSGFTLKLRKHIRTKRLEEVRQLGIDRVVDFQFGVGEGAHHIILELYAQGNILLTDAGYNVLTLLRTYRDEEKGLTMMVRHQYPVDSCRLWEKTSLKKLEVALNISNTSEVTPVKEESAGQKNDLKLQAGQKKNSKEEGNGRHGTQKKHDSVSKLNKVNLKGTIAESLGYGPALSEHIILDAGLSTNLKVLNQGDNGQFTLNVPNDQLAKLHAAVMTFQSWLEDVMFGDCLPEGYILVQKRSGGKHQGVSSDGGHLQVYEDFSPFMLQQYKGGELLKMVTFDGAMDEFFSKIEGQRVEQHQKTQEDAAFQKLDKIRRDQENRVNILKQEVDQSVFMAELIEYNLDDVESAILAVRTTLATGMDWNDLARMIKEERKAGNPVAGTIHSLQLEKNQITLLLSNNLDDMNDEEKTQPATKVEVDLSLSAHANARRWFELKKKQFMKQEKTIAAHEKAFKAAEKKTQKHLAQEKVVAAISHMRKVHWFEKFNWFISSENYLIISGRDAQQNELVVKRYMKKGDLYVHADLHGASSTVIKNHDPSCDVPPLTLNQAGCFTVCHSQAWDSKIVTSAWWVYAHQVSKTAPTGEYLSIGSFMIRGKKNFLPPHPLVMGFGVLFRLDESCIAAHVNEKKTGKEEDNVLVESDSTHEDSFMDEDESFERLEELREDVDSVSLNDPQNPVNSAIATQAEIDNMTDGLTEFDPNSTASEEHAMFNELMDKALELPSRLHLDEHFRKYGLNDYPNTVSTETIEENGSLDTGLRNVMQKGHPRMSKSERKKNKKGPVHIPESEKGMHDNAVRDHSTGLNTLDDTTMVKVDDLDTEPHADDREFNRIENPAGKTTRGRKGKLKKIKEKYSEQDDEERELRMALLASAGRHGSSPTSKRNLKATKQHTSVDAMELDKSTGLRICYKCKKPGHLAKDCPNVIIEAPELNMDQLASTNADDLEKAAVMTEENIFELSHSEKEKLTELDSLTEKPFTDDILQYAVPVCGPYNAFQGYKYRVKLTPGSLKRGKAAKTALNVFLHIQEATSREKELMKAMSDPELVAAIISSTKVTAPGLTQLKKQQKKGKKASVSED